MKVRIALLSLLTICCVALAALPAMATVFINTGGPRMPSPIGEPLNNSAYVVDVSWFCPYSECAVTSFSYWSFNGTNGTAPVPQTITSLWSGPIPFNFKGGTTVVSTTISQPLCLQGDVAFCQDFVGLTKPVLAPYGLNWLNLYNETDGNPGGIFWSANATDIGSTTLVLGPNGVFASDTSAFSISGTAVPEPGSILLLGTGILGFAGVLRRKLKL
jgi:hypothetical protein